MQELEMAEMAEMTEEALLESELDSLMDMTLRMERELQMLRGED
mgnify:FL=1